ncbi:MULTISPECIES: LysE family translocator [unclassified Variovorax]|uniref:LysE family translocator n=1 Tax=unclassified Variovorax TaxID=663243 RepID=UPI000B87129C|nr:MULTISPECIES: LysE family translocator [unclassified Variovorax]
MNWSNIWLFLVPFAIAAALPGPAQGTLVATVLSRGKASAFPFVAGMVFGNAVWLVAAIFGLAAVALRYELLFLLVKWGGVAYLVFVAWKLWTSSPSVGQPDEAKPTGFLAGAMLTLGNPKAAVFFGAVLPQAFDLTVLSHLHALVIIVLGVLVDFAVQCAYLKTASKARRFISTPRHLRVVNRGAAAVIACCAALIARRA